MNSSENRLRRFGHILRRNSGYIGKKMLCLELPGRRSRGSPKRSYVDAVREKMKVVGVRGGCNGKGWMKEGKSRKEKKTVIYSQG